MSAVSSAIPQAAQELLPFLAKEALQSMGRSWELDINKLNKEELIALLIPHFDDPERIDAAVRSLAPRERAALDLVILSGGRISARALRGQLESADLVDPPVRSRYSYHYERTNGSYARVDSRRFEDILARLGALGLAFPWPPLNNGMVNFKAPADLVVIPDPILHRLPPVAVSVPGAPDPATVRGGSPETLLRDVVTVVSAIQREPIELTTKGLIPKRFQVKLAKLLSLPEGELAYPTFIVTLARGVGLLITAGGKLLGGSEAESFLRRPRGERLRRLYEAYAEDERWSELTRVPDVIVRGAVEGPHIAAARARLLDLLSRCPPERWITIDGLVQLARRTAYEFLLPRIRHDPYGYYRDYPFNPYTEANVVGLTFSGIYEEGEGWNRVEAGFIRVMLTEPLVWLGMVDLGAASEDVEPSAFRLTEIGGALLGGRLPELTEPVTNVVVQPNFQVFAFEPTGEDVLFQLDRLADRVSAQQALEYRITRDSIYRAQQSGMEVEEIVTFLQRVSAVPLPQNVHRSIEEWAAQNDRIVVRSGASVLQTIDEATMDALYARDDLSPLLGRRLAPTAALVPYGNLSALNARLAETGGPVPALTEGNDAQFGNAIRVAEDGRITFRVRLPSVYVQRATESVAEPGGDGSYRITRASLRRAAKHLGPDDIIRVLGELQGAPLPREVMSRIQTWTKHWGSAALSEVMLLQVDSSDILEALMDTPELRPYLQRLQGAATSALVRKEGIEIVRQALEERDMELRSIETSAHNR